MKCDMNAGMNREAGMITRRDFALGAVAAGAVVLAAQRVRAALSPPETLSDGHLVLPVSFLLPKATPTDLRALGLEAEAEAGSFAPACNVTLCRSDGRLVLFDAGSGSNFMPTAGKLPQSLAAAGIDPADVTDIVFTHAHPDHIWGVLDDFDELLFPEARYHIAEAEWDYWRSDKALSDLPEERHSFVAGARNRFAAIEERATRFRPGAEVLPGIEAVAAAGHTPGHTAFVVHGEEPTMIVGDAISNDPVSFLRPDWHWGADQDPETGAATRKALLDRLAVDRLRFVGFHLPKGGVGRVERADGAYRFVAED